ncbi:hypothetical protein ABZ345_31610 [Lentzea sp. NPDC005914]|uniref:hypothetical protein n=1 Tax=Lentzea sp. NPDC005914 TaxID=3154572 RepID=UPI0033CACD00
MKITEENKLKGSLFIEAYGSLIDGIGKEAESETEKALDITFNAIGAASATVMLVMDPLGSLIGAGIGWLIEHVSFLRDALNQLMGNPEEIQANVEATKARAAELRVLAEDHKSGLATFDGWTGTASEAYKKSMDGMAQELDELAQAVETKAKIVAIMGMLVTVLRDIVRDMISQLLGSLIGGAILAAAAMIPTFGASIPAFIGFAVGKAVALGTNIASRVARVVAALARQMKRIGDLDGIMAKISKGWERFENSADVAEISYEGYKASKDVDKKIDEAVANNAAGGGGGGGGGGGERSGGKTAQDTLAQARVGTVQHDAVAATPMHMVSGHTQTDAVAATPMHMVSGRTEMDALAPMQARTAAEPMHMARAQMDALEPMQARTAMTAAEPVHMARAQMDAVQPLQRFEAVQAPLAPTHMSVAEPMQPLQRMEAAHAPLAPTHMNVAEARMATDSTMTSGVSMTSGTPMHEAVQPMQAREMYNSSDSTPAESSSGYEPLARTQMSHTFEALQPAQESYNPLQARTAYSSVEATPAEPVQYAAGYDAVAQSGGAPVQPLRPTVAHERPTRPSE